jgi:putative DNA primase/helicase
LSDWRDQPVAQRASTLSGRITVEALGVLLQQNPNGLLVHRDEMLSLLDRMDEEGHADERGFYLTGWAGNSAYTFDRIGRGLDLHVDAVCLSMLGGTQPGRISPSTSSKYSVGGAVMTA